MSAASTGRAQRIEAVRRQGRLNGIDYVEVETLPDGRPVLQVFLVGRLPARPARWLDEHNIRIAAEDGAPSLHAIAVWFRDARDDERDDQILIELDRPGGDWAYTLELVGTAANPLRDIDPELSSAPFRVIADVASSDTDCRPTTFAAAQELPAPDLDYLAKDYDGFRRVLLDRLSATMPDWRERHGADLFVTLVEVLAYHADHLSYAQDAVATEAYLDTARLRTSVRRHARLIDYRMHDGCNARAWLTVEVEGNPSVPIDQLQFLTRPPGVTEAGAVLLESDMEGADRTTYEIFEPLPERGWEEFAPPDILRPRRLAKRMLHEKSPAMEMLRDLLDEAAHARMTAARRRHTSELVEIELRFLRALLDNPELGHDDPGPHPAHGPARRRRNRCTIQQLFPEELAQPARYRFRQAHNSIPFHPWHGLVCCLPAGTTSATLRDTWSSRKRRGRALDRLAVGDVLILEELVDPSTGSASDADPLHRHPVRLTHVRRDVDPVGDIPVVEIRWADEDALPFTLTICTVGPPPSCEALDGLAVARGNVVLVDHGETVRRQQQPRLRDGARTFLTVPFEAPDDLVPAGDIEWCCADVDHADEQPVDSGRYAPRLAQRLLVFAAPIAAPARPASEILVQDPRAARAQVALFSPVMRRLPWMDVLIREVEDDQAPPGDGGPAGEKAFLYERWSPRRDLLASDADDRHFVVEVEDDGRARIRFGDGSLGARPVPDTRYLAWYRVGGGLRGNVGRDSIRHVLCRGSVDGGQVTGVRNPMEARGGTAPEPVADVRLHAPYEIRTRLARAVTGGDYAALALREFSTRIQRAAAELAPTADNRTVVRLFIDPVGTTADDADLRARIANRLRPFVRIGHRLEVRQAEYVPIDLTLRVRPSPRYRWGAVVGALRHRFGDGIGPDGERGFFHPDRITFGQPVVVSAIVAAALGVPGVASVEVVNLTDHAAPPGVPLDEVFRVGQPWRIARLDNDPFRPANGVLTIEEGRA